MDKHELFEELEAFNPKWQSHYASTVDAAYAAGVLDLYYAWKNSPDGKRVTDFTKAPDVLRTVRREAELAATPSLKYKLANLHTIPRADSEE